MPPRAVPGADEPRAAHALNSVIGFANIVRRNSRGALSAAELTYLERITENGQQLLHTINSILDLSKIEADQEPVELEMVSLPAIVRDVLGQLEPQATVGRRRAAGGSAGAARVGGDGHGEAAPRADQSRGERRQVHATRRTRGGAYRDGRRVPPRRSRSRCRTPASASRPSGWSLIFEAFEQGDVGVNREYGGTGLGLSISRALCRLLHCELTVSSTVGVGSLFRVALPASGALASLPAASSDLMRRADAHVVTHRATLSFVRQLTCG